MIRDRELLKKLIDSNPQVDEFLTNEQARLLDFALEWDEVEKAFGLVNGTLEWIYDQDDPMTIDVLEVLWELYGEPPIQKTDEPDIWI